MIFPKVLKRICDITFYLTFASVVGNLLGSGNLIGSLPFFAAAAIIGGVVKSPIQGTNLAGLVMLAMFLVVPLQGVNLVLLLPAMVFMVMNLPKPDEAIDEVDYTPIFKNFVMALCAILAVMGISSGSASTPALQGAWLSAFTFLVTAIMFMRMVRHDESVLKQTRFKVINGLSLGLLFFVVLIASTPMFLSAAGSLAVFILTRVLLPILGGILWLIGIVLNWIAELLNLNIAGEITWAENLWVGILGEGVEAEYENGVQRLNFIPMLLGVILLLAMMFFIFKILAKKTAISLFQETDIQEERTSLDDDKNSRKGRHFKQENQLREVYRKLLRLLIRHGFPVTPDLNSRQVADLIADRFPDFEPEKLRHLYLPVRYGSQPPTKEELKEAQALYKTIKTQLKKQCRL